MTIKLPNEIREVKWMRKTYVQVPAIYQYHDILGKPANSIPDYPRCYGCAMNNKKVGERLHPCSSVGYNNKCHGAVEDKGVSHYTIFIRNSNQAKRLYIARMMAKRMGV